MNAMMKNETTVDRISDVEYSLTRTFNGPVRIVFATWSKPELLRRWWVPKSFPITLLSLEADVRAGGKYRFVFKTDQGEMAFFGTYLEVVPNQKLVWTNEESGHGGAVTTVTFEDLGDKTRVVMREKHPSKEAVDEALQSGACEGTCEAFEQLETLVPELGASA